MRDNIKDDECNETVSCGMCFETLNSVDLAAHFRTNHQAHKPDVKGAGRNSLNEGFNKCRKCLKWFHTRENHTHLGDLSEVDAPTTSHSSSTKITNSSFGPNYPCGECGQGHIFIDQIGLVKHYRSTHHHVKPVWLCSTGCLG